MRDTLGLYVHVPFCTIRCSYCDFAIVSGQERRIPEYLDTLAREVEFLAEREGGARPLETIHFGGGTPSKLDGESFGAAMRALRASFRICEGAEIALEANPEDVSVERVTAWLGSGLTRLTVGVQSLDDEGLRVIGRPGLSEEGPRALAAARKAGVGSLGADFIFGRPDQSPEAWADELERLLALDLDHLSLYALELDSPTPLVRAIERGETPPADPDLAAEHYGLALKRLVAAGYSRYEISNFAKPGHRSRHNLRYWTDAPYLGVGPSAASYSPDGRRWTNARGLGAWTSQVSRGEVPPTAEPYDAERRAGEALVFGMRLDEGADLERIEARHGALALSSRRDTLRREAAAGRVLLDGARARLAPESAFLADEVFVDLL